jgi:hypothetical protein
MGKGFPTHWRRTGDVEGDVLEGWAARGGIAVVDAGAGVSVVGEEVAAGHFSAATETLATREEVPAAEGVAG